ncbi:MAG TPA: EAL domain-containing protein [Bauldia sp.]|nr:EAL domain-containing protein [Bauldia sp.]
MSDARSGGVGQSWRISGALELVLLGIVVLVTFVLGRLDSFEWFYKFTRAHEYLQLDEVANFFFLACIALVILLAVRARILRVEIHRRTEAEEEARSLARHDPLTGIANRRLFGERLMDCVTRATEAKAPFAVLILDLNRFKAVNDIHGHAVGDELLMALARRLQTVARREDTIARLGGDEFGLAICNATKEVALTIANRIVGSVEEPFMIADIRVEIGVSVGIALFPSDASSASGLLHKADLAMYRAKASGMSSFAFFDPVVDEAVREREVLQRDLRQAVGTDAIVPYYQPLVDLTNGKVIGFEVLARWHHPTRGKLSPELFIPIAEDARIIGRLFLGLLQRALKDAAVWDPALVLSVNVAPDQFRDRELAEKILSTLAEQHFPPERLEVELTETALVTDMEGARQTITELKNAGVRIAIDDFGKGYSSLYYLRELPFDVVKIDQSFVSTRQSNPESAKIVAAVIGLSEAMGLTTVAEGIEQSADAEWLRTQGCDTGQGFLYSEPVPAADVPSLLPAQAAA